MLVHGKCRRVFSRRPRGLLPHVNEDHWQRLKFARFFLPNDDSNQYAVSSPSLVVFSIEGIPGKFRSIRVVAVIYRVLALAVILIALARCESQKKTSTSVDAKTSCFADYQGTSARDSVVHLVHALTTAAQKAFPDSSFAPADSFLQWIDTNAALLAQSIQVSPDSQVVSLLKSCVYDQSSLKFDPNRNDIRSLLPQEVLRRDSGSCLGVSLLFLGLGHRLHLPLYGVLIPTHFFVRYESDSFRVNIEPNLRGYPRTDSYYRKQYSVSDSSWYTLRNLSIREVAAVAWYNLGNIFLQHNRVTLATNAFACAIRNFPDFAEAHGNLGLAYDRAGELELAIRSLEHARFLRPSLPNLSKNMGIVYLRDKRYRLAVQELDRAAQEMPTDPQTRYVAALAHFRLGAYAPAADHIVAALALRPEWDDAKNLKEKIYSRL